MDIKTQCQGLLQRAQQQFASVIDSIQQSLAIKLENFRLSYENQLQQYLELMANEMVEDANGAVNVVNEVNQFRQDIKQTMGELNKYLIYLNSYKLTPIMNRRCQRQVVYSDNDISFEAVSEQAVVVKKKVPKVKILKPKAQKFNCDFCSNSFLRVAALKDHLKVEHEKVTTFRCPKCGFQGSRSSTVATHILQRHRTIDSNISEIKMTYTCPFTEITFISVDALTKHIYLTQEYLRIESIKDSKYGLQLVQEQTPQHKSYQELTPYNEKVQQIGK